MPRDAPSALPIVLTFLAPAERCNQRCPQCYLETTGEPIRDFSLSPQDYADFVGQLLDAEVPILSISFQGFEVTLPRSWPYVEAVFAAASPYGVPVSFITNGMLLAGRAERCAVLKPQAITVSLDGASEDANDRLRGLPGAFQATLRSLRRFLKQAPSLRDRVSVASVVYDEANFVSLLRMPALLTDLGLSRWRLSPELIETAGRMAIDPNKGERIAGWLLALQQAADGTRVRCDINDELGLLDDFVTQPRFTGLRTRKLLDLDHFFRFDPTGHIRRGAEVSSMWGPASKRRWRPGGDNAADAIGYGQPRPA